MEETKGAIKFYVDCVNGRHLPYVLAVELKETGEQIGDIGVNGAEGNNASVRVLEMNGYEFVKEEFGAEDDPYGNGMLIYKREC